MHGFSQTDKKENFDGIKKYFDMHEQLLDCFQDMLEIFKQLKRFYRILDLRGYFLLIFAKSTIWCF